MWFFDICICKNLHVLFRTFWEFICLWKTSTLWWNVCVFTWISHHLSLWCLQEAHVFIQAVFDRTREKFNFATYCQKVRCRSIKSDKEPGLKKLRWMNRLNTGLSPSLCSMWLKIVFWDLVELLIKMLRMHCISCWGLCVHKLQQNSWISQFAGTSYFDVDMQEGRSPDSKVYRSSQKSVYSFNCQQAFLFVSDLQICTLCSVFNLLINHKVLEWGEQDNPLGQEAECRFQNTCEITVQHKDIRHR